MKENYTQKQRNALIVRDGEDSQLRHYSEEEGWHHRAYCRDPKNPCKHLEEHHITPRRLGGSSDPRNLITLAKCEHVGVCPSQRIKPELCRRHSDNLRRKLKPGKYVDALRYFVVHPDIQKAYTEYDGKGDSFKKVFAERDIKVKNGQVPYWNSSHDTEMRRTAEERTAHPLFKFPRRRR